MNEVERWKGKNGPELTRRYKPGPEAQISSDPLFTLILAIKAKGA